MSAMAHEPPNLSVASPTEEALLCKDLDADRLRDVIEVQGFKVEKDDGKWHHVMVLPLIFEDDHAEWLEWQKPHPDPVGAARRLFRKRVWEGEQDEPRSGAKCSFEPGMSKYRYHEVARGHVVSLLSGIHMGLKLETKLSIDGNLLFLLIQLESSEAAAQMAELLKTHVPMKISSYPLLSDGRSSCPTTHLVNGQFVGTNYVPLHMEYETKRMQYFEDLTDKDRIRLCHRRIIDFLGMDEFVAQGVIVAFFPVHRSGELYKLWEYGWNKPWALQYPGSQHVDAVRNYFGAEVGFFFHTLDLCTSQMMIPAVLGGVLALLSPIWPDPHQHSLLRGAFGAVMVCWSAFLPDWSARVNNAKAMQWGIDDRSMAASAAVRRAFDPLRRGTRLESFKWLFHWILSFVFASEAVVVTLIVAHLQRKANESPTEEVLFGLKGERAFTVAAYLLTVNVIIIDNTWNVLCGWLTRRENWKTEQKLSQVLAGRIFVVRSAILYMPYLYTAFLQEHFTGCGGKLCIDVLAANLTQYFVISIFTSIAVVLRRIAVGIYAIIKEHRSSTAKAPDRVYSYMQVQNNCEQYIDTSADFMDFVLMLGFVEMFAIASPVLAALAVCSNMVQTRMLAFGMSFVMRRPHPRVEEGIGVWTRILKTLGRTSVTVNVGIFCFCFSPVRDFRMSSKLFVFIALEHVLRLVNKLIDAALSTVSPTLEAIEERNEQCLEELFSEKVMMPVRLQATKPPLVEMVSNTRLMGTESL